MHGENFSILLHRLRAALRMVPRPGEASKRDPKQIDKNKQTNQTNKQNKQIVQTTNQHNAMQCTAMQCKSYIQIDKRTDRHTYIDLTG